MCFQGKLKLEGLELEIVRQEWVMAQEQMTTEQRA